MKTTYIATIFTLFISLGLQAQEEAAPYLHKYTPPAPNAAALAKYGDVPVSYYTGTPQISIPIYAVTEGSLSVPISISYHASGIRVGDKSSWIGLGWSLNAGGSISRTVRGLQDEQSSYGFFDYGSNIDNIPTEESAKAGFYRSVSNNARDVESDMYFYSYPRGSGKFFYDYNRNKYFNNLSQTIIKDPSETGQNDLWMITSTEGHKYYFSSFDESYTDFGDSPTTYSKTAWHLDQIISNDNKDTISFEYYPWETMQYDLPENETYRRLIPPSFQGCGNCPNPTVNSIGEGSTQVKQHLLKRIVTTNTTVDFITASRIDIGGSNRLSKIEIKDREGRLIKEYVLDNDNYFGNTHKRLKLSGIKEGDDGGNYLPPHTFTYNETHELPDFNSKSVDHWGFYNNNTQNTLIPDRITNPSGNDFIYNDGGADKSTDESKVLTYMLTDIAYPTGGTTHFDFESHDVSQIGSDTYTRYYTENLFLESYDTDNDTKSLSFTLTESTTIEITATVECIDGGPEPSSASVVVAGELIATCSNGSATVYRELSPGTYSIDATSEYFNANWYSTARVSVKLYRSEEVQMPRSNLVGGVRVKRITTNDSNGTSSIKRFIYQDETGNSSGVLVRKPFYHYVTNQKPTSESMNSGCNDVSVTCSYNTASSNSKVSLGEGTHIGYGTVIELYGENGENGSRLYTYTTAADFPDTGGTSFPFEPAKNRSGRRGKLLTQSTFDANGNLLAKKELTYSNPLKITEVSNLKVGQRYQISNSYGANITYEGIIDCYHDRYYKNVQEWQYLSSERNITYSNGDSMMQVTTYHYERDDNHLFPTSVVNTDGETSYISRYKYPDDYNSGANANVSSMQAKNIVSIPIEKQKWVEKAGESSIVDGQIFLMNDTGKPLEIWLYEGNEKASLANETMTGGKFNSLISDTDYKKRYVFNYDNDQRPISQQMVNDAKTTILWDKTAEHVLAQAINCELSEIAYSSFETNERGGWSYAGTGVNSDSYTGSKHYQSSISKVLPSGEYMVQLWARKNTSSSLSVSIGADSKSVSDEWALYSWNVSHAGGTLTVSVPAGIYIDEARLFPSNAQMTSYTYDPVFGVTSMTDVNGISSFYEYDSFGRLQKVKDKDQNILKSVLYNYGAQE